MKKYYLLILLSLLAGKSISQNANTLFITYARSKPQPGYIEPIDGGGSYTSVGSNTFGLRYFVKSRKIVTLETGIDFSKFIFKFRPSAYLGIPASKMKQSVTIISVPIYAHLTLFKYFFINGGAIIDTEIDRNQTNITKQTGIGFGLGAGLKYRYRKMNIYVNPSAEHHAYFTLGRPKDTYRQSTINPGIKIGIGYSL